MVITSTTDFDFGLAIKLDDRTIFRVSQLPKDFAFQLSESTTYFIREESPNSIHLKTFVLYDHTRREIASAKEGLFGGTVFGTKTVVGKTEVHLRMKAKAFLDFAVNRQTYIVDDLGIELSTRKGFRSSEVKTFIEEPEEGKLAVIVLLHFAKIWDWREDPGLF